jgi:hypothetical protein
MCQDGNRKRCAASSIALRANHANKHAFWLVCCCLCDVVSECYGLYFRERRQKHCATSFRVQCYDVCHSRALVTRAATRLQSRLSASARKRKVERWPVGNLKWRALSNAFRSSVHHRLCDRWFRRVKLLTLFLYIEHISCKCRLLNWFIRLDDRASRLGNWNFPLKLRWM